MMMRKTNTYTAGAILHMLIIWAALLLSQQIATAFSSDGSKLFVSSHSRRNHGALHASKLTYNQMRTYRGGSRNGTEYDTLLSISPSARSSFWLPSEERQSKLKVRRRLRTAFSRVSRRRSRLEARQGSSESDTTWSRPVDSSTSRSSLGVRSRVKAVLKKAKSRTGVKNASEDESSRSRLAIAEVASIGGLAEESDVVIKKNGVGKVNGVTPPSINGGTAVSNGAVKANGVTKANGVAKTNGATANGAASASVAVPPRVEDLTVRSRNTTDGTVRRVRELDVLRADVPTPLPDPLPFKLPKLTAQQRKELLADERVQEQSKMGREGSGYVVMDIKAPPYLIWECLLDFENYPELIKTVRSMEMFTSNKLKSGYHEEKPVPPSASKALRHYGIPSVTRAAFILSKFKLNIAAIHNYRPHPDGHYMKFNLDPDCTNSILKSASGIWHTQSNPDGRGEEYTRVWLLCELKVSRLLPQFIVDYTAKRAMPRATNWLKPHVEPIAETWRKEQEQLQ